MKKVLSFALCLLLIFCLALPVFAAKDPISEIELDSQGVYLWNLETDTALYTKGADLRMYPASITKVMTVLVVLENCADTTGTFITSPGQELYQIILDDNGMNMAIKPGETFTVQQLLEATLLNSYCDSAQLLAWYFGGHDVSKFVDMMNDKVAAMGLTNTHFQNAHGLHSYGHYSSPRDLAMIFREAMKDERFMQLIRLRTSSIPATEYSKERPLQYSINMFFPDNPYYFEPIVGGKSGFTDEAGRCQVTYCEKDGVSYILVLMGANMDTSREYPTWNMTYPETRQLLEYAYENFEIKTLFVKGQVVTKLAINHSDDTIPVVADEEIRVLVRKGADPEYRLKGLPAFIDVSGIQNGTEIGKLELVFSDEVASAKKLVLSYQGQEIHMKSEVGEGASAFFAIFKSDKIFVILIVILALIFVGFIIFLFAARAAARKRRRRHTPKH